MKKQDEIYKVLKERLFSNPRDQLFYRLGDRLYYRLYWRLYERLDYRLDYQLEEVK